MARKRKETHYPREERDTLRVFYAPKEREETPAAKHERLLREKVEFLENITDELSRRLSEREQELLEALSMLEDAGLI